MDAALLPVKGLRRAKERLSGDLSAEQRHELARALFEDALALAESCSFLRWWVVSDDDEVLERARTRGFGAVRDPGRGLNAALAEAIAEVRHEGATSVTVVPCDVPLAWRGDIEDLLDTGATSDVVVVPSGEDGGTNALYLSPPDVLAPRFGVGSLKAHLEEAAARRVRCSILTLDRLALDIDTIADVDAFLARTQPNASATRDVLSRIRRG